MLLILFMATYIATKFGCVLPNVTCAVFVQIFIYAIGQYYYKKDMP